MGEQEYVLYCQCLWTCNIIALESSTFVSSLPFHKSTETVNSMDRSCFLNNFFLPVSKWESSFYAVT
ncbi:hypothetical protein JD844_024711 [Phrynosoma platyrhinos]|uniref:Uncharacterized protein n=1 Tax=Phrynosoma platyrhinos TaxID=52577 RepID=A0ABQ7SYJ4_PHRPL|nr:hypothetical protein JD844_024711 [Phrynosoma platyrhinos]